MSLKQSDSGTSSSTFCPSFAYVSSSNAAKHTQCLILSMLLQKFDYKEIIWVGNDGYKFQWLFPFASETKRLSDIPLISKLYVKVVFLYIWQNLEIFILGIRNWTKRKFKFFTLWTLFVGNLRIVIYYRFIPLSSCVLHSRFVLLCLSLHSSSECFYVPLCLHSWCAEFVNSNRVYLHSSHVLLFSSLPLGGLLYWIAWLQTKWWQRWMEKQDTGESSTCKRLFIHQPLLPRMTFLLIFD